jgi:hypothetical protein
MNATLFLSYLDVYPRSRICHGNENLRQEETGRKG